MESRMGQAWARWSVLEGKWPHRFAPDRAPLRCARPVVFPLLSKPGCLAHPPGMKDFELYQQILGLVESWRVESVTLKPQEREIEVRVGSADTLWGCPQSEERRVGKECRSRWS